MCLCVCPRASVGIYPPCVVVPSVPVRVYLSFVRMVAASRAPDIGIVHSDDDLSETTAAAGMRYRLHAVTADSDAAKKVERVA